MKKTLIFLLALVMAVFLCACGDTSEVSEEVSEEVSDGSVSEEVAEEVVETEGVAELSVEDVLEAVLDEVLDEPEYTSYQEVLDAYTVKLQEATPVLIEEYNAEAAENTDGITGLAALWGDKVSALAEISMEGIQEMAAIYLFYGDGTYSEYEEWAGKLQDVYLEEGLKIQEAYLKSVL